MQLKTLKEIIKKKENKSEFAIVTNLTTGNSEIFEKGKSLSKDFEKFTDQINTFYQSKKNGITFISEAFIDRRYRENYSLVDRNQDGAFLETIEDQMNQVKSILFEHKVLTNNNKLINIKAQTLCIHGDSPNAAQTARAVYRMLKEENIKIRAARSS